MAFSRLFLFTILFALCIGFLSCEDPTAETDADAAAEAEAEAAAEAEGEADVADSEAELPAESDGALTGATTAATIAEGKHEVVGNEISGTAGSSDPCSTVSANFAKCDEKLTTCELLEGYQSCVGSAITGCADEAITSPIKEEAKEKETNATEKLACSPVSSVSSTESISTDDDALREAPVTASTAESEALTSAPNSPVTPSKAPPPKIPATSATTPSANLTGDVADKNAYKEGDEQKLEQAASNSSALPPCEREVVDEVQRVQRCNDKLENQGDICFQMQNVVDCVEKVVVCSHEVLDYQVENYLQSLEDYIEGHDCILTYRGARLELRPKSPKTGAATGSGTSFVCSSVGISISAILFSLFFLH